MNNLDVMKYMKYNTKAYTDLPVTLMKGKINNNIV